MALNKYMHPRNIYKEPPDFSKLAKQYKDFSDIAKVDVTGKVSIDFKDPQALRILTKCLLKSDFNLDVIIPNEKLVPTLPLRLNYILWIEDLMATINRTGLIQGIDIGTGACAIYPLLGAVKNKWHMVGTETDDHSILKANDNINRNNLQDLIILKKNTTSSVIKYLLMEENSSTFDFCMCNPPFYTNIQELWESRSPARPPPKNGFTGSPHELITEGGELQFCRKIIEESKICKDKILIYTTMIGHKYNLKELIIDLKAEGIKYTTTEFCQGRVTRWGLAWTYQDYNFSTLFSPKEQSRKKSIPLVFKLPKLPPQKNIMNESIEKLKNILGNLNVSSEIITKKKNELVLNILAYSNTWSNQRRKRRLQKRLLDEKAKQPKLEIENNTNTGTSYGELVVKESATTSEGPSDSHLLNRIMDSEEKDKTNDVNNLETLTASENHKKDVVVQGIMKSYIKDNDLFIEVEYLNGTAGKEGMHQIVQYIKNNWK